MAAVNTEHKDRLFRFLFGSHNREWTLELFNAVNGTEYTEPEDILFTTIDDAVYMGMKNDLSFILFYIMNVYEQQSTYNPNMPVRQLMYLGKLYDKYIQINGLNLYGKKIIQLPVPKLVVFYNGTDEMGDKILKLSDAFASETSLPESDIEARVRMININYGKNSKVLEACRPLSEYAWLVQEIRKNREQMDIDTAVDRAIDSMPKDYVIRSFLIGNRAEVCDMCITEYNEAETMRMIREEGRKEGRLEGEEEAMLFSIKSLMETMQMTAEQAMTALMIPETRFRLYREKLTRK